MVSPDTAYILFAVLAFLLGTTFGSFGSVLVARVPFGKSIRGRSRCPQCGHVLHPKDLIPLVSFVLLGGACRTCAKKIPWKYPLLELGSGAIFLAAFCLSAIGIIETVLLALALWFLLLITISDAEFQGIPDVFNLAFFLTSAIFSALMGVLDWRAPLIGVVFFGLQWMLSGGRWVGSGDVLLAAGTGALLGSWDKALLAIGIAYIIGALYAVYILATRQKKHTDRLAFGPFLALGTVLAFFWGDWILQFLFFTY